MNMHLRLVNRIGSRSSIAGAVCCAALAAALALAGCGAPEEQAGKMTSFSAADANGPSLFTVTPEEMSHVQVYTVTQAPLVRMLRLSGAVAYNGFETTPVISQVSGPVSRVLVVPGEHVRAGQPLLYVASPDYSQLRSSYLKARDAFRLADLNNRRAQDLYAHKAISQRDLEVAQSDRDQAEADLQASEQALHVLGVSNPEKLVTDAPSPEIPVLAPVAGEVVDRLVAPGQLMQAGGTQCFTVSNMSTVWVLANIYQNDLAYVHVGDPVTVETDAYPGVVRGRISYLAPALDPATRTLQARIVASNPGERLKKDMFVTVNVRASTISNALTVPDSAVLRDSENMPFVYVLSANNQAARRPVTIGESQGGKTQILTGLQAGDRIIGDGSLFLQFQNSLQR
jgi:cobalt-zinc-cadmium efflux system membrane fusion protein